MISVVLNAKDEERIVKVCLESVKWVDEIIVVLNDSTDGTEKIASQFTDKIYKIKGQDFSKVKNLGLEKASGDWILFIDADERVLRPLREEIQGIVKEEAKSAYAISRENIIFGSRVNYGPYKHDWVIRLVKKDQAKGWTGKVHEHLEFEGQLGYTRNSFLHLTHRNLDQFILKSLEWSRIDAKLRFDTNHPKMSGWRFLRILFGELLYQGVVRKGFFSGTVGVVDSILQTFSLFIAYVRLWQFQQGKSFDQLYEELDQKLVKDEFNY